MNTDKTINIVLKYTAFVGILAVLFTPMIVRQDMFFLFITGKAFTFRILVEIIFALWAILALRDRSYIPKRSWIFGAIAVFTLVVGVADIFGAEPLRSIWSNYERMEGFVWIAHLFLYFVAAAGIIGGGSNEKSIDNRKLWAVVAHVSLLVSLLVGVHGFSQLSGQAAGFRIDSYLGNSTYLGVYALVHIFLALYFWLRNAYHIHHARKNNREWKVDSIIQLIGYTAIGIFNLVVMYHTGTRGSFVGLAAGLVFVALIIALREKTHKIIRNCGIALLGLVVAGVLLLGAMKNTDFVKSHGLLARFSALATLDFKGVLQNEGHARTLLWGIAYHGFVDNPILGWGQDNFGYVFAKHYDPAMYGQEPWFDRTHNVIFDWLIAAGLLGLLSYLALFVAIIHALWKKTTPDSSVGFELYEKAVLTGLLIAYFFHNLFVFDNLASYIFFFSLLAFVYTVTGRKHIIPHHSHEAHQHLAHGPVFDMVIVNYIGLPVVVALLVCGIYFINVPGYKANHRLIAAMTACHFKQYDQAAADFKVALAYNSYEGQAEIREQLISCTATVYGDSAVSVEDKKLWLINANNIIEEQARITPEDPRPFVLAGTFLNATGQFEKSQEYLERALKIAQGKQQPIMLLALSYINTKQVDRGLALFDSIYRARPDNHDISIAYATALVYTGKEDVAIGIFGATSSIMTDDQMIVVYEGQKKYSKVVDIYRARAARTPDDVRSAILPGVLYLKYGDRPASLREFRVVLAKFPEYKKELQSIIDSIAAGKNPFEQPAKPASAAPAPAPVAPTTK